MAREMSLKCDHCGKEIVGQAGMPINDHIAIYAENSPTPKSDFTYAVMLYPKLPRKMEFCDLKCLRSWIDASNAV